MKKFDHVLKDGITARLLCELLISKSLTTRPKRGKNCYDPLKVMERELCIQNAGQFDETGRTLGPCL